MLHMRVVSLVCLVALLTIASGTARAVTNITCNASISSAIAAAPTETVFLLAGSVGTPCTYTSQSNLALRNNIEILGGCHGQAIGSCSGATIIDGGAANVVLVGGNPAYGYATIVGILMDGFTVQNYLADTSENNNSMVYAWNGWVFRNMIFRISGGWGLSMPGGTMINSKVDSNKHGGITAELGLPGIAPYTVIRGSEISNNNTRVDNVFNDAAGLKMVEYGSALIFVDNYVHDNIGVGVWGDISANGWKILGNTFVANMAGVQWEIATNCEIAYNVFNNNFYAAQSFGAPVWLSSASTCDVHDNNMYASTSLADGLIGDATARVDTSSLPFQGITLRNNTITFANSNGRFGLTNTSGAQIYGTSSDYNRFYLSSLSDSHFYWMTTTETKTTFATQQSNGQETHSVATTGTGNVAGCTTIGCSGSGWPLVKQVTRSATTPSLPSLSNWPTDPLPLPASCAGLRPTDRFNNAGSIGVC